VFALSTWLLQPGIARYPIVGIASVCGLPVLGQALIIVVAGYRAGEAIALLAGLGSWCSAVTWAVRSGPAAGPLHRGAGVHLSGERARVAR
jgi:hypothetical protein